MRTRNTNEVCEVQSKLRKSHLFHVFIFFIIGLTVVINPTYASDNHDMKGIDKNAFCTNTSKAAFRGCQNAVRDDYWITIGICTNESNPEVREECKEEAKLVRNEDRVLCGEQFEARQDICEDLGEAPYDPQIDPGMFVDPAEIGKTVAPNPYFPLVRGNKWVLKGGTETITDTVIEETKVILGVTCATILDVVDDDGEVIELTKDWYAQDIYGNVWYFGEIAQDFEEGELISIDGSWKTGRDGDKAGIIMKAVPEVGDVYRQEFSLANAEDMGEVLSVTGTESVPAASCDGDCLVTKDFTPIEPDVFEHKYYAPGIGIILEVDMETGERVELVEVINH